jgi:hypothetical protein
MNVRYGESDKLDVPGDAKPLGAIPLAQLVRRMRQAQAAFSKTRGAGEAERARAFHLAKGLERATDAAVARILAELGAGG